MTPDQLRKLITHEPQIIKIYLTMLVLSGAPIGEPFSIRTKDISREANINISSLYRHFPVMQERGLLHIEHHGQGRTVNTYRLGKMI